ncbi:NAD-glutamate dehydrogenase [Parvibium lacunae]|uniref:NAD-glutamate dehydrogenase n=1 Tax=Parvibium lacunae TaxID=1888893 RepID=A0A368L3P0_9BURK|nr:NAD-glutamate dehydrogenase [Parvibium lacunae]RCS58032.1 NAD-glutamate dehydrogenase [Parvibium lacunae]
MTEQNLKQTLIRELKTYAAGRLNDATQALANPFLEHYFQNVDSEELQSRKIADLYGTALSHLQLAQQRKPGEVKARVYQPNADEHGWESTHTVVEIVNDDMPFLVDSVSMEINRSGYALHLIIHPQIRVQRDDQGRLQHILPRDSDVAGSHLESYIHIELDQIAAEAERERLQQALIDVLSDVRCAVEDWATMCDKVRAAAAACAGANYGQEEIAESQAFIQWLLEDHFTLLGYREYDLVQQGGKNYLQIVAKTGLGILRDERNSEPSLAEAPAYSEAIIQAPECIFLTTANTRATVHRPGYLDYVGVKRFDAQGKVIGEARIIGLYTSTVYTEHPEEIPLIRRKVSQVMQTAGFLPRSHLAKSLEAILDTFPRDELFQSTTDELFATATGILRLQERQRTRLFVRRDPFNRFYSCLLFVPREKYNTELRQRIQSILLEAFQGYAVEFTPHLSESMLARIHMVVRTRPENTATEQIDVRAVEARLIQAVRRWVDDLQEALVERYGEAEGNARYRAYAMAFPAGYREEYPAIGAVADIALFDALSDNAPLAINLYRPLGALPGMLRFKVCHRGGPLALSDSLPMLERMGVRVLDERPYAITPEGAEPVWLHDIGLQVRPDTLQHVSDKLDHDLPAVKALFEGLFEQAWAGAVENDDFNSLVLAAGLEWRQIVLLRAYAAYFKQLGLTYSASYIANTLAAYPHIARQLVALFVTRFELNELSVAQRDELANVIVNQLRSDFEAVANLDQDRIVRQYLETILATLRTNYYQLTAQGEHKAYISFKFDPSKIPNMPEPRPMFEIFVYSARVEGVHLRGGKVARGGLRWSDRREDFRTEILGLVKAQMVKNTVIVPVGSKGGFVLKKAPPMSDREAYQREGIECYKTFLRGLLDLTDNLVTGQLVPPAQVVRHDPDDPYLVVAADKGTATFSDIANSVSEEYGFWLGDAFASGGGNGYDHKKMGITARGAWESVKRHFREMGRDTQTQDFTVVGVGDMSGDVFGNGMLLSRHIRLLAAFDHRHVFLDPNPDAARSFEERERIFALPRSSWEDYNRALISAGGGIYPLSAKTIPLSPEVKAVLGIDADSLTPNELKMAILKAPVDLLYNGGIGTYVKASTETHQQVGDRANDAIRVNGADLRCKVVGEGGNLGCTQLGRIEAAMHGVKLCTDAIDNSAGVDCSDHEVNIKILLNGLVAAGDMTLKQRNELLANMTEEVGLLVLEDNYYQTQCLSVTTRRGLQLLEGQTRLMHALEASGRLKRRIEYLPTDEQLLERRKARLGLSTPENAVLLAYAKMQLFDDLIASDIPDDAFFQPTLLQYFPKPIQTGFADAATKHPLKREIIATCITNTMLNRVGATFVHRAQEETGAAPGPIVRAYILTKELFGLEQLWAQIDGLDNQVSDKAQGDMLIQISRFVQKAVVWLMRRSAQQPELLAQLGSNIARLRPHVAELLEQALACMTESGRQPIQRIVDDLIAQRVPAGLADAVAVLETGAALLDIVELATEHQLPVQTAARFYHAVGAELELDWVRQQIAALPTDTHWQTLARAALRDDLALQQRNLTLQLAQQASDTSDLAAALIQWRQAGQRTLHSAQRLLRDLQVSDHCDLAMLSVALRELRAIA